MRPQLLQQQWGNDHLTVFLQSAERQRIINVFKIIVIVSNNFKRIHIHMYSIVSARPHIGMQNYD